MSVDPLFANPAGSDYHLKSNGGRYGPTTGGWVTDALTSWAVDAGDPSYAVGNEPLPNGGRINMGAYGGTSQASKTVTIVIDDGDPGWTTTENWSYWTGQGYDGDVHQAEAADTTATWSFSNLDPNEYYQVEATWTTNGPVASSNRADNAPYTITGGAVSVPVYVNQKLAPVGVNADNGTWQELGVYEPTSGTLAVTLANNADGYVIADAVRLEAVPTTGPAIMVQAGTGSASDPLVLPTLSGTVQTTVSFATVAAGAASPQETFTVFNGGGATLSVSSVSAPTGYTFVAGTGFSSSGTATVLPGDSAQFVLQEDTSTAGTLGGTVTLATNDSSENPFSFPVTGTAISPIIDDCTGAAGGWTTTGTWSNWTNQGCDGNVHQAAPAATADSTATWTFTGLGSGQYYRVETTWSTNGPVAISNRASNAPYTISGGTVALPVYVDQKLRRLESAPTTRPGRSWACTRRARQARWRSPWPIMPTGT